MSRMKWRLAVASLLPLLLLTGACTLTVEVRDTDLPTPAIDPIPAHVAVVFDHEFRTYEHTGPSLRSPSGRDVSAGNSFHYKLGSNNVSLFTQLTESMFEQVSLFDSRESVEASGDRYDAVLEITIEHFDAWQGEDGGARVPGFFLDLVYGIKIYGPQRQQMLDWSLESHQVFCNELTFCGPGTKRDIVAAGMRDIAAQFYLKFPSLPEVAERSETLSTTVPGDDQGIVVMGTQQDIRKDNLPVCLEKALKRADPENKLISARIFRESLFPFFEPGTAPENAQELSIVLGNIAVQERIQALGVRFLVVAGGKTRFGEGEGGGVCSYGGCLGATWTDKATDLAVLIWDFENADDEESLAVSAEGHNVLLWFFLPIPIIANTKRDACDQMSDQVLAYVRTGSSENAIPATLED